MKKTIVGVSKEDLLVLKPEQVTWMFSEEEILYLFGVFEGFWAFNDGMPYHAELRSGLCSDGFFYSKKVLESDNLCKILANQIAQRFLHTGFGKPDYVIGIPDGASKLGEHVAGALDAELVEVKKDGSSFIILTDLQPGKSVLVVEDFSTRATAFQVLEPLIYEKQPMIDMVPLLMTILLRGLIPQIDTEHNRYFVSPLVEHRIMEYEPGPKTCYMCDQGSKPIKPKPADQPQNWGLLNTPPIIANELCTDIASAPA